MSLLIHKQGAKQPVHLCLHATTQDIIKYLCLPVPLQMYMFLPGFERFLWDTLEMNNIVFASDEK